MPPSYDEIEHLYSVLDQRNETIAQLEKRFDEVLRAADFENENVFMENTKLKLENEVLRGETEETKSRLQKASIELLGLKGEVENQKTISNRLEKKLEDSTFEVEQLKATYKAGVGDQFWLEKEALKLRDMVAEFKKNEERLVHEVESVSREICSLEKTHKVKLEEMKHLQLAMEEQLQLCQQYETENKLLLQRCKVLEERETEFDK